MTTPEAHLRMQATRRQGALVLSIDFTLTQPWTILFGPSGSGKTTVLRMIAGFVTPNSGLIQAGANILFDSQTKVNIPVHRRPVRSAAQSARLFPHMTLQQNIRYGNGWLSKPGDADALVEELMELFRLTSLANKMPGKLSGGESQRASVARAILSAVTAERSLILLDEPFTGLDVPIRDELIAALPAWLRRWNTPLLSVTHDVAEAFQLDAEVIKLAEGRVVDQGPVRRVLAEERTRLLSQLNGAAQNPG